MEHAGAADLRVEVTNKQILSIALPITLAILVPQINMLINSVFLGHLSAEALGDAGITGIFYLIFAVAGHGLNNAMQTVFSRSAGSGDHGRFKIILAQGVRISVLFAVLCILFTQFIAPAILEQAADPAAYPREMAFLRIRIFGLPFLFLFQMGNAFLVASLNSRLLMFGFFIEAGVNVSFDWLLIFGKLGFPAMGFNGAAVASVISEIAGMITVFVVISRTGLKKQYDLLRSLKLDREVYRQIVNVATPLVFQFMISLTTWLVFFFLLEGRGPVAKAVSNTMRNVFGLAGVFVWAFAGTCNAMVSNLMGQQRRHMVLPAITRIMFWSMGCCLFMVSLLNLFPIAFFDLFGQDETFVQEGIPVIRIVSCGMLVMSAANIWLNGVTGTGKTKMNLAIEIIAITLYMGYTWYFMKATYISLTMAWSNELVYWSSVLLFSFLYLKSKRWAR